MFLWIHDTRCEAKLISAEFLILGDDLSVWDFQSSLTFPWLLMIFQSSMTFHDFSRKFYFSRFSRPCRNPDRSWAWQIVPIFYTVMQYYKQYHEYGVIIILLWKPLKSKDRQFDKSVVTGSTANCHYNTLRCLHLWQSCQIYNLSSSLLRFHCCCPSKQ